MKRLREMLAAHQPVSHEVRRKLANAPVAGKPFHAYLLAAIGQREKEGGVSHPVRLNWLKEQLALYPEMPKLQRREVINRLVRWLQEAQDKPAPPAPETPQATPPHAAPVATAHDDFMRLSAPERFTWLLGPVMYVKGVGPRVAALLQTFGVKSPWDLLWHAPTAYEDLSAVTPLNKLVPDVKQLMQGVLTQAQQRRGRRGQLITHGILAAPEGQIMLVWFNQPYAVDHLPWGQAVTLAGKPKPGRYGLEVANPELEPTREAGAGVIPVYPLTEGLTHKMLRKIQRAVLDKLRENPVASLPPQLEQKRELMALGPAFEALHFPPSLKDTIAPRKRLIYEELLLSQLFYVQRRQRQAMAQRPPRVLDDALVGATAQKLGFDLSPHQQSALVELFADLRGPHPMRRLLQGDVGSGKTAVCALCMAAVAGTGQQAALVAPTEILAEQHYLTLKRLFAGSGLPVGLLTGGKSDAHKRGLRQALGQGAVPLVVGTHALFEESVSFDRLGLIVLDEHHRFGVAQRHHLTRKAPLADLLVMTATPIPRTLALTLYGDLKVSVIAQPPKTRAGVQTRVMSLEERLQVLDLIKTAVARGEQVYYVCPLIEESDQVQAAAATQSFDELKIMLPGLRLGLLHGRMKVNEKEAVMEALRRGELDILVATTVIEVGVDIPGATLMVIEHAERFGLSQLHQLRGRVGRASRKGLCVLLADLKGEKARERLYVMASTHDGFEVAKLDLAIRGPGRILGTEQSGHLNDFFVADLSRSADQKLLEWAREDAEELLAQDPALAQPPHGALKLLFAQCQEKFRWMDEA